MGQLSYQLGEMQKKVDTTASTSAYASRLGIGVHNIEEVDRFAFLGIGCDHSCRGILRRCDDTDTKIEVGFRLFNYRTKSWDSTCFRGIFYLKGLTVCQRYLDGLKSRFNQITGFCQPSEPSVRCVSLTDFFMNHHIHDRTLNILLIYRFIRS